jgi:hypothetical protein
LRRHAPEKPALLTLRGEAARLIFPDLTLIDRNIYILPRNAKGIELYNLFRKKYGLKKFVQTVKGA